MISKITRILFWSVLSAAFIGPGTLITASSAGAHFGLSLLWALVFSTLACILLQEAAARLPLAGSQSLGAALAMRLMGGNRGRILIAAMVISGCAAYEAGNLLGASKGFELLGISGPWPLLLMGLLAGAFLYTLSYQWLARILGIIVAFMGLFFFWLVWQLPLSWNEVLLSSVKPAFPEGADWHVIGLIGTTIVPYNLFLGSGISKGQSIAEMRWGLSIAVLLGGLLSMAILLTGTMLHLDADADLFLSLQALLAQDYGTYGQLVLPIGLIAAGFTSAITAPLAASITAASVIGEREKGWTERGTYFRLIWLAVLAFGLFMGFINVKPAPLIIMAQAFNGFLLPGVAIFLYRTINDPSVMPAGSRNHWLVNIVMALIVWATMLIGLRSLLKGLGNIPGLDLSPGTDGLYWLAGLSLVLTLLGIFWPSRHRP